MEWAWLLQMISMLLAYGLGALLILFSCSWLIYKTFEYAIEGNGLRSFYCGVFLSLIIIAMFLKWGLRYGMD